MPRRPRSDQSRGVSKSRLVGGVRPATHAVGDIGPGHRNLEKEGSFYAPPSWSLGAELEEAGLSLGPCCRGRLLKAASSKSAPWARFTVAAEKGPNSGASNGPPGPGDDSVKLAKSIPGGPCLPQC